MLEIDTGTRQPAQPEVIAAPNTDAGLVGMVDAMGATLTRPGQKPLTLLQTISDLDALGQFAVAVLPQLGLLCNHMDARVAGAAIAKFEDLGLMAINGGDRHELDLLGDATDGLTQACGHACPDVQAAALDVCGMLGATAKHKDRACVATIFTDSMMHIAAPSASRGFVRAKARQARAAIQFTTPAIRHVQAA